MFRLVLAVISLASLTSCGGGTTRAFADIIWQVRCPEEGTGCPQDGPRREVNNLDGEDGFDISCEVEELNDTQSTFAFSVVNEDDFSLEVSSAVFTDGGAIVGAGCVAEFEEDDNTYRGDCSNGEPSADAPCQLTDVAVDLEEEGGPTITASMLCRSVPNIANPTSTRDLTRDGNDPEDDDSPFSLRFVNCTGL